MISPVADFGYGHSRLVAVDAEFKAPGTSSVEFAYRIADSWAAWSADSPAWIPLRPGEALPDSARGRYAQVKAELYPDGSGRLTPRSRRSRFASSPIRRRPRRARLVALPKDGAVELHWTKVPEADLAGYLVYYGDKSPASTSGRRRPGPEPHRRGQYDHA